MIWIIRIFILALFAGSNIYFFNSALSLINIFFAALVLFYPLIFKDIQFKKIFLVTYSLLGLQIITGAFYLIFAKSVTLEAFKDFLYSLNFAVFLAWMYWWMSKNNMHGIRVLYNSIFVIAILLSGIVLFELISEIHLPSHSSELKFRDIPTAAFKNPNDLSVVMVMMFIFLDFWSVLNKYHFKRLIVFLLTAFVVFVTLSRMSLIIFIGYLIFNQLIFARYLRFTFIVGIVTVLILSGLFLSKNAGNIEGKGFFSRSFRRIESVYYLDEQFKKESSVSKRLDAWKMIFRNPGKYITGNGWNSAGKKLAKDEQIKMNNPHSFFLEMLITLGFTGFLPMIVYFLILLYKSLLYFRKTVYARYAFVHILFFIILANVPSSIVRFPVVWFLLTIPVSILFLYPDFETRKNKEENE